MFLSGYNRQIKNTLVGTLFCNTWSRRLYSILKFSRNTTNMNKLYFRYMVQEEKVDISFAYKIKESTRQFNFSRKPSEFLQTLFLRIEANIKKAINKASKKKNTDYETAIDIQLIDSAGNPVPMIYTCKELFDIKEPLNFKIHGTIYETVFNAPWVLSISLPQCLLVGFTVIPDHFQTQYAAREECIYKWYKETDVNDKGSTVSELHVKWEQVGNTFTYTPTAKDVGMKLKLECTPSKYILFNST